MADISKETLRKEIKEIVAGADLSSLTSRVVRQQLEKKFGINLSSRKKEIDELVMADVEDQTNSHSEDEVSEEEVTQEDYRPKAGGRKAKASPKKRKAEDSDDDDDWGKKKQAKKPAAAPGAAAPKKRGSAFTKSFKLSPELADVVGSDVMPRHEVVKKLWAVIKERELQDPQNKQFAICDDQLMKVFGVRRFRTFGMMKHLKDHFLQAA